MENFDFEILNISHDGNALVRYIPDDPQLTTREIHVFVENTILVDPDPQVIRNYLSQHSPQWRWVVEKQDDLSNFDRVQHIGVMGDEADIPPVIPKVAQIIDLDTILDIPSMVYVDALSPNNPLDEDGIVVNSSSGNTTDIVQRFNSLETNAIYSRRRVAGVWYPGWSVVLDENLYGWRDLVQNLIVGKTKGNSNDPKFTNIGSGGLGAYEFEVNDELFLSLNVPHEYVAGSTAWLHFHFTTKNAPSSLDEVTWGFEFVVSAPGGVLDPPIVFTNTFVFDGTEAALEHSILFGVNGLSLGVPDGLVLLRVFLDNHTLANNNDIYGLACGAHYQYSTVVNPILDIGYP